MVYRVPPFAGAWIEIPSTFITLDTDASLPSRERGLKSDIVSVAVIMISSRSLRGSVD